MTKRKRKFSLFWQFVISLTGGTVVAFLLIAAFLNTEGGREVLFCPFLNESLERVEKQRGQRKNLKIQFAKVNPEVPSDWVQVESEGLPLLLPAGKWEFHGDSAYLKSDRDDRLLIMPLKEVGEFLSYVRNFPGVRDIQDEYELMESMYSRDISERCKLFDSGSEIFIRFALIEPKTVISAQGLGWIRKHNDVIWWYQKTRGPQNFGWIHIMMKRSKLHYIVMTRRESVIASAQSLVFAPSVGFQSLGLGEKVLSERLKKVYPPKIKEN